MPKGDVETYCADGRWRNRLEQAEELGSFDTQEQAVAAGRAAAKEREVEHIVRDLDGRVIERRSYGIDPQSIIG